MHDIIDIAKRECKGQASKEEVEFLHQPKMRQSWLNALTTALSELDSQMTYHRDRVTMLANDAKLNLIGEGEYMDEKEKFDSWQRKALRYKAGIQKRITEVKTMASSSDDPSVRVQELIEAIVTHKQQSESAGLNPEPHDIELWESITK